jgi:hypothetical protein
MDAVELATLNELAQALTFITYASAQLSHLDADYKKRLLKGWSRPYSEHRSYRR